MKSQIRKFFVLLCGLVCIVCLAVGLTACDGSLHKHKYSNDWESDKNNHWHAATCEHTYERSDEASHTYDADNICTVCGYEKPHEHSFSNDWTTDDFYHWRVATCEHSDEVIDKALHVDNNNDNRCDICNLYHEHTYEDEWSYDINAHWHWANCAHIDEKSDEELHIDEDDDEVCDVCEYRIPHSHTYESNWSWDNQYHWKAGICHPTAKAQFGKHEMTAKSACSVCKAKMGEYAFTQKSGSDTYSVSNASIKAYGEVTFSRAGVPDGVYYLTFSHSGYAGMLHAYMDNMNPINWEWISLWVGTSAQDGSVKAVIKLTEKDQIITIINESVGFNSSVTLEKYDEVMTADESNNLPVTSVKRDEIPVALNVASGSYTITVLMHGNDVPGTSSVTVNIGGRKYSLSGRLTLTGNGAGIFAYTFSGNVEVEDGDDTISLQCKTHASGQSPSFTAVVSLTPA